MELSILDSCLPRQRSHDTLAFSILAKNWCSVASLEHNCEGFSSVVTDANIALLLARLESAYSLIWGSHKIWGKGGGDTLALYDK